MYDHSRNAQRLLLEKGNSMYSPGLIFCNNTEEWMMLRLERATKMASKEMSEA